MKTIQEDIVVKGKRNVLLLRNRVGELTRVVFVSDSEVLSERRQGTQKGLRRYCVRVLGINDSLVVSKDALLDGIQAGCEHTIGLSDEELYLREAETDKD